MRPPWAAPAPPVRAAIAAEVGQLLNLKAFGAVKVASRDAHPVQSPLKPGAPRVRNSIAHGWHVAARTAVLQVGLTVVVALAGMWFGWRASLAVLTGGLIVSTGNILFALRLFGRGVAPARDALRSVYAAEVLKWIWLCAMLYLAIAVWKLPFPGLIAGVLAAQLAFWIALIATR